MAHESHRYGTGDTRLLQRVSCDMEHRVLQPCNLDGIFMNIQEENSLFMRSRSVITVHVA